MEINNKKTNTQVFLIHNKGTLASKTKNLLQNYFVVENYLVNKKKSAKSISKEVEDYISENKFKLIIFISGETQNEKIMKKANQLIPINIANLCSKFSIPLIYLSSLSVFGIPKQKVINGNSLRDPYDIYGMTKNSLDIHIKNKLKDLNYSCIAPGSIINPDSNNQNLIKQGINVFKNKILKLIFLLIGPSGNYACVHIDDLVSAISIEANKILSLNKKQKYRKFKCCAVNLRIYDLIKKANGFKPIFKLKSIEIKLLKILTCFLNSKTKMKIFVYFTDFCYFTEYSFLSKRSINEYLKNN